MPPVNLRLEPYDVYIGRGGPWGNPFPINSHQDRSQVIALYTRWFLRQIRSGNISLRQLAQLDGARLGCYCKPLPCHGDQLAIAANIAASHLENSPENPDIDLFCQELAASLNPHPQLL